MIVTFYSYKGGVGRSFCLANVAVQLARWGNRVLCVDFDLDAPGLHEYFRPFLNQAIDGGLAEVITGEAEWTDVVVSPAVPETTDLHLLAAGRMDESYADRAQALSWPDLFAEHDLGWRFEKMREEWEEYFDFVLIDSRTGVTDIGGICTAQLPDVLVLCVAPNRQNLVGTLDVAKRAAAARDRLPYDRAGLLYLPVLSRFDGREEYERARTWRTTMAEQLAPLYTSWLPTDQNDDQLELGLVERTTVPYLPYWSFGEEIAVVGERSGNPETVSYFMDNIAALLAHGLSDADVLVSNRDTYVSAAREGGQRTAGSGFRYDVLVHGTSARAEQLTDGLKALGVQTMHGRSAELSVARHFVIVDPPARISAGVQEILDEVQLDPTRIVIVVAASRTDVLRALASVPRVHASDDIASMAVDVVRMLPAEAAGSHWESVLVRASSWLRHLGHYRGAYELADRATTTVESPLASVLQLARLAVDLGRFDQAENDLQRVLGHVSPDSRPAYHAHRLLGEIYTNKDDLVLAARHFEVALKGSTTDVERALVYRALGYIERRNTNYELASDHMIKALRFSEGNDELAAVLTFELGAMKADQGQVEQADFLLRTTVEMAALPADYRVAALRLLAYLAADNSQDDSAVDFLRRARDEATEPQDRVDISIELARVQQVAHGADTAYQELARFLPSLASDDHAGKARLWEAMGNLRLDDQSRDLALEAFAEAHRMSLRAGDRAGEVRALIGLAEAHRIHNPGESRANREEARRLLTRLSGPEADLLRRQLDAVDPR
ncbi:tetratricopeptide repeat protein [Lentzea alba]|uniref:KGGVGR-motif variant AAA ATPase n=1 Tax=Lentzea alba TaxID=2714351 RepID=UPI0039BFC7FD